MYLKRTASGASGRADVHRYAAVVAELMTNEEPKVHKQPEPEANSIFVG